MPRGAFDNDWNPLKEAYENTDFNSYDTGPGKYLPTGHRNNKDESYEVYVSHLPHSFTEDGIRVLFSKAGKVLNVKICSKSNNMANYGFVAFSTLKEAELAISKFNNWKLADFMPLRVSLSYRDKKKLLDHQERAQHHNSGFNNGNYSNESDSEDSHSDSRMRTWEDKFSSKHGKHSSTNNSRGKQGPSENYSSKKDCNGRDSSRNQHRNMDGSGKRRDKEVSRKRWDRECSGGQQQNMQGSPKRRDAEDSGDRWGMEGSHKRWDMEKSMEQSSNHQKKHSRNANKNCREEKYMEQSSQHQKNPSKSARNPANISQGSNDSKKCANCGKKATKRCSRCKMPYCSIRCQEKDWAKGHQDECVDFNDMSLNELADRFDVDLNMNPSVNNIKTSSPQSNSHQQNFNSSSNPKGAKPKWNKSQKQSVSKESMNGCNTDDSNGTRDWGRSKKADQAHNKPKMNGSFKEEPSRGQHVPSGDSQNQESMLLPFQKTCKVLVTYVDGINIYVQLGTEKSQNIQKKILVQLYEHCDNDDASVLSNKSVKVGQLFACVFSVDNVLYRTRVTTSKRGNVEVKYIDFGNSEMTSVDKLRILPQELKEIPPQAVCCTLELPPQALSDRYKDQVASLIQKHIQQDAQYSLKVISKSAATPQVCIYDDDVNINEKILGCLDLRASDKIPASIDTSPMLPVMARDVPLLRSHVKSDGHYCKLKVVDVESAADFTVHLSREPSQSFRQFTKKLNGYANSYNGLPKSPVKGQLVLVRLEKQEWARAEVLDLKNGILLVSLIDFGSEDKIKLEDYCPADKFCLSYPRLCIPSALEENGRINNISKLTTKFKQGLKSLTNSEDFSKVDVLGELIACEDTRCRWNLYDLEKKRSIVDILTAPLKVMASQLKGFQVKVGDVLDGLAVEILEDSFYIIEASESQVNLLKEFNTYLEEKDDGNGYTPCVDELVAAKFSQDNQWYRGQIISETSADTYEVFFVDYGNSECVHKLQLQPFPSQFTQYPKQALHCYIANVSRISDKEDFSQLICSNVCKYKIEESAPKNMFQVVIYSSDEECISDCLEKDTTKAAPRLYSQTSSSYSSTSSPKSKSASLLSVSPIRSCSQSSQSSAEEPPDNSASPTSRKYSSTFPNHDFGNQFSSSVDGPTKKPSIQPLDAGSSSGDDAAPIQPQPKRMRHFAKSMGGLQLKMKEKYDLLCKWVVDTDCFYCQLVDTMAMETLREMNKNISEMCRSYTGPTTNIQPQVGEIICAMFTDGEWYRAKVLTVLNKEYSVFFVDIGCNCIVYEDEIAPLTVELAEIPILAARFSLAGKSKDKWSKEQLLELCEHEIAVEVVGENQHSYNVVFLEDLKDKNTSPAKQSSNQNTKEFILQQIEQLKKQLESLD